MTFRRFDELTRGMPGNLRLRLFGRLPRRMQRATWDALAEEIDRERAEEFGW